VSNAAEAFDKYIADGGPAYVAKFKMSPREAVDHIHQAGGLAFMAHPGVFLDEADGLMDLIAEGFDGVEVYHPTHNATWVRKLEAIAQKMGLLMSGGSDFHGFAGRDSGLGALKIPYEVLEKIEQRIAEGKTQ
jgi:predicted metal-dependent phosphoesterase TrpH